MPENDKTVEELQLQQIEEMKLKMESMVDPEEFKKLQLQYKKLLDDYVNKRPVPKTEQPTIRPTKEIAKEFQSIQNGDITNRDYVAKALEYRKAHINEFGKDPFSDFGQQGSGVSTEDTNEVATVLQTLLDENPSPVDFRIKLNSVLKDDPQLVAKLRKRVN